MLFSMKKYGNTYTSCSIFPLICMNLTHWQYLRNIKGGKNQKRFMFAWIISLKFICFHLKFLTLTSLFTKKYIINKKKFSQKTLERKPYIKPSISKGSRKKIGIFLVACPLKPYPPPSSLVTSKSFKNVIFSKWPSPYTPLLVAGPLKKRPFCGFPNVRL